MTWEGYVTSEKMRNPYIFAAEPEYMRLAGRPRRRWEDDIKMFQKCDEKVRTICICFRIGTRGSGLA
jgi:hypothetical protein